MNTRFNLERRKVLKVISGVTAIGCIASTPAMAGLVTDKHISHSVLDCKLISRADILRAHLLMHNRSKTDVVVRAIESQAIRYDDTFLNLARAYAKEITIPANDRVMVRLDMDSSVEPLTLDNNVIDMETEFLSFGTRVVDIKLLVRDGIGAVAKYSVLT